MKEIIKHYWWVIIIVLVIVFSILESKQDSKFCKCYEVVGDENNFICYTPSGEVDTKGECVGNKIYK